jgi:hypothetical protein
MSKVTVYEDSPANALIKSLEAPALDPMVLALANEHLAGKDYDQLASEFNVNRDVVVAVLNKKEVKSYIDAIFLNQGFMNRNNRAALINEIIMKKLTKAGEKDPSEKDILEWVKLAEAMENNTKPKEKGNQVNVQINNYTKLMQDLLGDNK